MKLAESNGWLLLAHPDFEDQHALLLRDVQKLQKRDPIGYKSHKKTKLLKNLETLVFDLIPQNPASAAYLQGNTLGARHRVWRRAKVSQQHRLYFRFDSKAKIIIYVWINDDSSLRAYGSKTDSYKTFAKMLDSGNPPSDWIDLLESSR